MSNMYDHTVMMAVQKAHQSEARKAAYQHHLIQRAKNHRPNLLQRLAGFKPALNIELRALTAQECTLNPAAC